MYLVVHNLPNPGQHFNRAKLLRHTHTPFNIILIRLLISNLRDIWQLQVQHDNAQMLMDARHRERRIDRYRVD